MPHGYYCNLYQRFLGIYWIVASNEYVGGQAFSTINQASDWQQQYNVPDELVIRKDQ